MMNIMFGGNYLRVCSTGSTRPSVPTCMSDWCITPCPAPMSDAVATALADVVTRRTIAFAIEGLVVWAAS